ncbi:MAG TPA: OmcA/MtrC family decaheme c-type cytochrome [Phototrophicaceae bacterium]|nr:OmcA/MtrC family decaheme c-type cytochrome [Phototrophicaceae bacterium]
MIRFRLFLYLICTLSIPRLTFANDHLNAQITSVKLTPDRRPLVTFKVTTAENHPLDLADLNTESVKFTIAAIERDKNGATRYYNYVLSNVSGKSYVYKGETRQPALAETLQPDLDHGGALRQNGPGLFTYTFKTALPPSYERHAPHVVGGEISRRDGKDFANFIYEFVPAGGAVRIERAVVETASCNNCHDPLKAHGGTRREVGYCALCHTSQLSDPETGESLDFKVFVHKIHRGKMLPSVRGGKPYLLVGDNQRLIDFSTLRYPQARLSDGNYKELRNCRACHTDSSAHDQWKKFPSISTCTSCHDDVDLTTGKNHKLGPLPDGTCVGCHQPEGPEFGPSILGAHTYPGFSKELPGVVFEILKITGGEPGNNPVVTFTVKNKQGERLDPSKLPNLRLVVAWPTTDYKIAVEEDARKAKASDNGSYTYKFKYAIPSDATGSGAVGIQGFSVVDIKKPNGDLIKAQRDVGFNVVRYFSITDKEPMPRRKAVKIENCNVCHLKLATHGEMRNNTEFCVMCHNAGQNDHEKRDSAKGPMPPQSVHYKRLIHRIHTGANLGEPFVVYGGTPAKPGAIDFSDIRFPGDRRNCVKCHVPGANEPPLPAGLLPTLIPQADGSMKALQPITSACVGCHTAEPAKLHMETMTFNGQESCVTCHGVGRSFAVSKVHQR